MSEAIGPFSPVGAAFTKSSQNPRAHNRKGGGGGVGIQGVQLAKAMGMRPIVIDTGSAKKALALEMGAEHFLDFREISNVAEEVCKIADGIGAHGVFVTAPASYKDALSYLGSRVGGRLMCIGIRMLSNRLPPVLVRRLETQLTLAIHSYCKYCDNSCQPSSHYCQELSHNWHHDRDFGRCRQDARIRETGIAEADL